MGVRVIEGHPELRDSSSTVAPKYHRNRDQPCWSRSSSLPMESLSQATRDSLGVHSHCFAAWDKLIGERCRQEDLPTHLRLTSRRWPTKLLAEMESDSEQAHGEASRLAMAAVQNKHKLECDVTDDFVTEDVTPERHGASIMSGFSPGPTSSFLPPLASMVASSYEMSAFLYLV